MLYHFVVISKVTPSQGVSAMSPNFSYEMSDPLQVSFRKLLAQNKELVQCQKERKCSSDEQYLAMACAYSCAASLLATLWNPKTGMAVFLTTLPPVAYLTWSYKYAISWYLTPFIFHTLLHVGQIELNYCSTWYQVYASPFRPYLGPNSEYARREAENTLDVGNFSRFFSKFSSIDTLFLDGIEDEGWLVAALKSVGHQPIKTLELRYFGMLDFPQ